MQKMHQRPGKMRIKHLIAGFIAVLCFSLNAEAKPENPSDHGQEVDVTGKEAVPKVESNGKKVDRKQLSEGDPSLSRYAHVDLNGFFKQDRKLTYRLTGTIEVPKNDGPMEGFDCR